MRIHDLIFIIGVNYGFFEPE